MALALLWTSTLVYAGVAVVRSQLVTVEIEERGPDGISLYIPLPAALVDAGLAIAPGVMPPDALADARQEIGEWGPFLEELAHLLTTLPDATLVTVDDGDERVLVAKRGRNLIVDVDSPDARVRVSVPVRTVERAVAWVAPHSI
jgi:hypothetical protein